MTDALPVGRVTANDAGCGCKVGRVIAELELAGLDEELAARRAGRDGPSESLRDLAAYFNQRVLRRALECAGRSPLEGEIENTYRLLTGDASSGERTRVRKRLERDGVDVEAVESRFVSHPTIGSHLTDCLGVDAETSGVDREGAIERVMKLQSRSEAVIRTTLDQLEATGRVTAGDLSVFIDAQLFCRSCGTQMEFATFVERGGCDCDRE